MNEEIQTRFLKAVKVIQNTSTDSNNSNIGNNGVEGPSNDEKLKFYALYKQSTIGPCNTAKPAFWDVVARAKWDVWNALGDMTQEEAMEEYVDELILFLKKYPDRPYAQDLIRQFQESRAAAYSITENGANGDTVSQDGASYHDAIPQQQQQQVQGMSINSSGLAAVLPRPFSRTPSALNQFAGIQQQQQQQGQTIEERLRKLEVLVATLQDRLMRPDHHDHVWNGLWRKRMPQILLILILILIFRARDRLKQFLFSLL